MQCQWFVWKDLVIPINLQLWPKNDENKISNLPTLSVFFKEHDIEPSKGFYPILPKTVFCLLFPTTYLYETGFPASLLRHLNTEADLLWRWFSLCTCKDLLRISDLVINKYYQPWHWHRLLTHSIANSYPCYKTMLQSKIVFIYIRNKYFTIYNNTMF